MGWFSSKKVTTVGTSVSRVIKDKQVPDTIRGAMITALYRDEDLVDNILEGYLGSLGVRMETMYRYAERESPYGLPTGEIVSSTQGGPEVQAVLDALEGQPVLVEYRHFGAPNMYHMAWKMLHEQYGYNPQTNVIGSLSSQLNQTVYLDDIVLELPYSELDNHDPNEIALWGDSPSSGFTPERQLIVDGYANKYYPPTDPLFAAYVTQARMVVKYVYETRSGGFGGDRELNRGTLILTPPFTGDDDYFHVKYTVNGQVKYWMYEFGSGVHPTLDAAYLSSPVTIGDYYPNIYFRLGMQKINKAAKPNEYRTQRRMAKYVGFDYDLVSDSLHENPDIDDVEQAFINFGVNADTQDPLDLQYLYLYFDNLYETQESQPETSTPTVTLVQAISRRRIGKGIARGIVIKDQAFKHELIHEGVEKLRFAGSIGSVGTVTASKGFIKFKTLRSNRDGTEEIVDRDFPCRFYRKQISPGFYDELRVINIVMKYYIKGKYYTTLGDENKEILLIPLDRTLMKEFQAKEREKLAARSMHLVANSRVVQKLKWYEQEWFADLLMIVAIVLTVISLGQDGGFFVTAAAAISAGSYLYFIYLVALEILIQMAIQAAIKLFVKLVGVDLAFLAALVAAAYGVTTGLSTTSTSAVKGILSAQGLLQLASGISGGISANVADQMADLNKEVQRFSSEVEEKTKLIEEGAALLENRTLLSPFVILGEKPKHYFKRTIHSGNIGTLIYDDLHNYVSRSLQLPDFSTSIGGIKYDF